MSRFDIHAQFTRMFAVPREEPSTDIQETDLLTVEANLKTKFPHSYISFATVQGPLFTPTILEKIVAAQEAGLPAPAGFDVREFLIPSEIEETYRMYVSGGMDDTLIPFAVDCSGDVFGFQRRESENRPDDLPVLFFDHEYCEIRTEAPSFDVWLQNFLVLK